MQAYKTSAMLKNMAKGQLLGKYPTAAAAYLSVSMITIILWLLSLLLVDRSTIMGVAVSTVVSFIISLLLGVINAGVALMTLKICCNQPVRVSDIFYGFNYQPDKIVSIQVVLSGAGLLTTLPASIFQNLFSQTGLSVYFLLMSVFYVSGIALYCYISLVLSQSIFLLLDFNDRTPREIMRMSSVLMKGHKGRLFYLWVSFIPLLLLGVFTCCIGYIWVVPYLKVALANFYMDLTQNRPQK